MINRQGTSLVELGFVLLIIGFVMTMALPSLIHARHVLAVRAARAEIAAAVAAARSAAIVAGGASLVIDVAAGSLWLERGDGTLLGGAQHIAQRHGVRLDADRPRLVLRYDPLGIGRLANAGLRVQRGNVSASLTISAYGRVRQ